MPLVVIDGCDNVGKTTLVKKLKDKYPEVTTFAFPQDRTILNTVYDVTDIGQVNRYHDQFLTDFERHEGFLRDELREDKTVVLDRYFPSHFAYFMKDIKENLDRTTELDAIIKSEVITKTMNLMVNNYLKDRIIIDAYIQILGNEDIPLGPLGVITMSHVVFFYGLFVGYYISKLAERNRIMQKTTIKGKDKNSFETLERLLKEKDYIK